MLRLTLTVFIVASACSGAAFACRPKHLDALNLLAGSHEQQDVVVFEGEIVGVRSAGRLEELKRCRPAIPEPQTEDASRLDCVERAPDIELDVYPLKVLHGVPQYPTTVLAAGCTYLAPRVGSRALVVQTREGSVVHIAKGDDPEYHLVYDDSYLRRVSACVTEKCLLDPEN